MCLKSILFTCPGSSRFFQHRSPLLSANYGCVDQICGRWSVLQIFAGVNCYIICNGYLFLLGNASMIRAPKGLHIPLVSSHVRPVCDFRICLGFALAFRPCRRFLQKPDGRTDTQLATFFDSRVLGIRGIDEDIRINTNITKRPLLATPLTPFKRRLPGSVLQ